MSQELISAVAIERRCGDSGISLCRRQEPTREVWQLVGVKHVRTAVQQSEVDPTLTKQGGGGLRP